MSTRRRDYATDGRIDWSGAKVGEPQPCVLGCGQLAHLRHPVTGKPCNKTCSDQQQREMSR
jgi:hypothetical protein